MRLGKHNPTSHRKTTTAPIVQHPTMARRPRAGAPDQTLLMPAVPASATAKPTPNFRDPSPLPGMKALTARDGITVVLPIVREHWTAEDATATQILPKVQDDLPPSAQHVNPARAYYEQTFVEDDGMEPQARGRHVLDELIAEDAETEMPDLVGHGEPTLAVRSAYGRVKAALTAPRPESLADAVRIARRAYKTSRGNRRWFVEEETKLDACRRRIAEFDANWDQSLRDAEIARHGQRAVVAAEELTAAYENNRRRIAEENARRAADGITPLDVTATTFTRGMQAKVKDMLVAEALAGSAVTR